MIMANRKNSTASPKPNGPRQKYFKAWINLWRAAWAWAKELARKFMVALKRRPHLIPLAVMLVAFLVYSLQLTSISDTTAKIQGANMGLYGFVTMLFSMLSLVCFNNAFPHRKPVNRPMWILMFVMVAIIIASDVLYLGGINNALYRPESPIIIDQETKYIVTAYACLQAHIVILAIGCALTLLLPIYSKWIRKVKTSIEVEDNGSMAAIELSND